MPDPRSAFHSATLSTESNADHAYSDPKRYRDQKGISSFRDTALPLCKPGCLQIWQNEIP